MAKETPIILSTPMVLATLNGEKTQTRRIIKPQPELIANAWYWKHSKYNNGDGLRYFHTKTISPSVMTAWLSCCPFGQVGDKLWVRERFGLLGWYDFPDTFVHHLADYDGVERDVIYYQESAGEFEWRGDDGGAEYTKDGREKSHWRPSIHMPKWAARIWLEITDVRVERIQGINLADIKAEGITGQTFGYNHEFAELWDKLNKQRGYGWEVNPWVWAISFKRIDQ